MKRVPLITSVIIIIGAGLVHGFWTDRWGISEKVATAASRVQQIPNRVGDWVGKPLEQKVTHQAGIAGQLFRRYVNARTGDEVSIAIVCGRCGPVCIHTPDVCYGASGYHVGGRTDVAVDWPGGAAKFYTADAVKSRTAERTSVRIFWAWYADGKWGIEANPRMAYAGVSALYKFYVIRDMATPTELKLDPCLEFLRQFLPALTDTLNGKAT